ncbi:M60 family metallopeptidase [Klebsiella michiganensis]|uniref:M60 family metallopeptidase n=1 Tax=Klebsiella michiganensis TaxID=1134687 RepID=UPI0032DA156E
MNLKSIFFVIIIPLFLTQPLRAMPVENILNFNNEAGNYLYTPLPSAALEAKRTNSIRELSDQQMTGRYVRTGDMVNLVLENLPDGYEASAIIGFLPMWGNEQGQQEIALAEGENQFDSKQDGPLFVRITLPEGKQDSATKIAVRVKGGSPLPLYVDGETSANEWQAQLSAYSDAPFVQLFGKHSMITLPRDVYHSYPVIDPSETFAVIDRVLDLEDELAGFDDTQPTDVRSLLRQHFLVSFRTPKREQNAFYMYTTDQFIGMLEYNTQDLTNPERLREEWVIWHEVGHTHQQASWTWDSLMEISTNLFSLYVQEQMGKTNRLDVPQEDGTSPREKVEEYLRNRPPNYVSEIGKDNYNDNFIRLVMFDQLRLAYGWELITRIFKHYRMHPLLDDALQSEKVDNFIEVLCQISCNDLRPFLSRWQFHASYEANQKIDTMRLPVRDL